MKRVDISDEEFEQRKGTARIKSVQGTQYEGLEFQVGNAPVEKRNFRSFMAEIVLHDRRTIIHIFSSRPVGQVQQGLLHYLDKSIYDFYISYHKETQGHAAVCYKSAPKMLVEWVWAKLAEMDRILSK